MKFLGAMRLPGDGDAGSGRRPWLAGNLEPHESVVDLGGTGTMLVPWHPAEKILAYDDLSGFGPGHHLPVRFRRGDVQSLPFADDEFDVAVLAEVMEHVPRPVEAFREAGRVAKRVLLTTPCEHRWMNGLGFRISGHIRFWTLELLCDAIRRAGLDGELALLEFGGWSFFVGVLAKNGQPATDRFITREAQPLQSVDTLIVLATLGQNFAQAQKAIEAVQTHGTVASDLLVILDEGTDEHIRWFQGIGATIDASPTRRGLVGAYNAGLSYFRNRPAYRFVHLLEDGVTVVPGWDRALRHALETNPQHGWVSCRQRENPRALFTAMCSLLSRDAVEKVGGFDPVFAPCQFDDGDLLMRLRAAGFRPASVPIEVSHPESRTSRQGSLEQDVALMLAHKRTFAERWGIEDVPWESVPMHQCGGCSG